MAGAEVVGQMRRGETKRVRVSYVPTGFGLALAIDDAPTGSAGTDGVLCVSDACVTLDLVAPDGRPSRLSWDPAEVDWDAMGLPGAA